MSPIWINATFKDQKEVNNNSPLCFSFITRSLNNLLSFSIYLQDDKSKEIEVVAENKELKSYIENTKQKYNQYQQQHQSRYIYIYRERKRLLYRKLTRKI